VLITAKFRKRLYISAITEVFVEKMIQNLRITGKLCHFDTLSLEYYYGNNLILSENNNIMKLVYYNLIAECHKS